jgi:hypothetical protein
MLNYMIVDEPNASVFIIRSALSRLSLRDFQAVKEWIESDKWFHVIHDHPLHSNYLIVPDLWGGRTIKLRYMLKQPMRNVLLSYFNSPDHVSKSGTELEVLFLRHILWPQIKNSYLFHNGISCDKSPYSKQFPIKRQGFEFLGEKYTEFGVAVNNTENDAHYLEMLANVVCDESG